MWKPVVGYEGYYEVSDCGEVRRLPAKWSPKVRLVTQHVDKRGYLRVTLSKHSETRTYSVHSLVMAAFVGPNLDERTINHKDLDKTNNSVGNLEYCSRLENTRHAVANGRVSLSGAKLSELEALEIRRLYVPQQNSKQLAEQFGVTQRTIVRIATGELWRHINKAPL